MDYLCDVCGTAFEFRTGNYCPKCGGVVGLSKTAFYAMLPDLLRIEREDREQKETSHE